MKKNKNSRMSILGLTFLFSALLSTTKVIAEGYTPYWAPSSGGGGGLSVPPSTSYTPYWAPSSAGGYLNNVPSSYTPYWAPSSSGGYLNPAPSYYSSSSTGSYYGRVVSPTYYVVPAAPYPAARPVFAREGIFLGRGRR